MNQDSYNALQIREVFHLEFLRWFARKLEAGNYALKGGVNLRFFFGSIRYSEDVDIDIQRVGVEKVKKIVLEILASRSFSAGLKTFGIDRIVSPDMAKAKQTETTQRFKIHLITSGGEDLFTKVEFSRRESKDVPRAEPVPAQILRPYKMAPLVISHYAAGAAIRQKIQALASRSVLQARDIFDLFVLSSQCDEPERKKIHIGKAVLKTAYDNIFLIDYPQFRDTVVAYLGAEDQKTYSSVSLWDEIKLKTANFLEEFKNGNT